MKPETCVSHADDESAIQVIAQDDYQVLEFIVAAIVALALVFGLAFSGWLMP